MEGRIVRYSDLMPCYNAFIDCRTPGSEAKENFTIIGPGVSENPQQHVHIAEAHGFNIGGARQPPNCVNSQHSHKTAEVFVVHSGVWRFDLGEHGEDVQVELHPGDVITLPLDTFRGFTNVGTTTGFLWAVLGQDNPGRVVWAPRVFDMARHYGLVLLESGQLIDTAAGQAVPAGAAPMAVTGQEEVALMRHVSEAEASSFVWRDAGANDDADITRIIRDEGEFGWPHGFALHRLRLQPGERLGHPASNRAEVLFVHAGTTDFVWNEGAITLGPGDTITVPIGINHSFVSDAGSVLYAVQATT